MVNELIVHLNMEIKKKKRNSQKTKQMNPTPNKKKTFVGRIVGGGLNYYLYTS